MRGKGLLGLAQGATLCAGYANSLCGLRQFGHVEDSAACYPQVRNDKNSVPAHISVLLIDSYAY
jgi:hypothetical protein